MSEMMKHKWKFQRRGGDPAESDSYEYVRFCEACGAEERAQFSDRGREGFRNGKRPRQKHHGLVVVGMLLDKAGKENEDE